MRFLSGNKHRISQAAGMPAAVLACLIWMPVAAEEQDRTAARMVLEVQQLREEVRELRGLVESQQREIENLRRRQRDQYMDLDRRLEQAGSGPAVPGPAVEEDRPPRVIADPVIPELGPGETEEAPPPPEARPDVPEVRPPIDAEAEVTPLGEPIARGPRDLVQPTEAEQAEYDRAFRALRETRYADAAEGFDQFLRDHPDSAYAPNAQYWLGEVYYVTRDFETALEQFNSLLRNYPGSGKEGDALLKIGFSNYELRRWSEARAALEQVVSDHPGTTMARLAETRLRTMRLEGHF